MDWSPEYKIVCELECDYLAVDIVMLLNTTRPYTLPTEIQSFWDKTYLLSLAYFAPCLCLLKVVQSMYFYKFSHTQHCTYRYLITVRRINSSYIVKRQRQLNKNCAHFSFIMWKFILMTIWMKQPWQTFSFLTQEEKPCLISHLLYCNIIGMGKVFKKR